jgi:protein TonB
MVGPQESEEQPPEPEPTPEPPVVPDAKPVVVVVERPKEESKPAKPATVETKKPDTNDAGAKSPGAPGGSQLKSGTPSAGGKLGVATGVREITEFEPTYPRQALLYGQQGVVMLRLKISADGTVVDRSVEKSSGYPLLDEAALSDCCRCRFRPATRDGKPVECECCKPFRYEIANR